MARFSRTITAGSADIDELGHVNNAVWVAWIQDIAVAHWNARATEAERDACVWVVTRHEIDYRGNLRAGEQVTAETWIPDPPRGARFNRHVQFLSGDGKVLVAAVTSWALLDRASGRLMRVPAEMADRFRETATEA
ncbi:acyl-CoA thioesterase [Sphingomonas sp. HT-1]|uniref:acyl-CoA thioesterase n=1 Tax=unclassified Sphingomonas TaxID=196159 RepID=UPI0002FABE62|nr:MULTISPECIES: acyl-CoA thioesterase [unclassified Sphingomonas]KTF67988.1 thioesterase [Sphingomonas sp. WG]